MTDREIFDGIARKDDKTFLFLYNKHKEQILRMVQKNSGNEADALDVFQEGLIALWTNIGQGKYQLRENTRISSYLHTLCRNLWISKLRKRKVIYSIEDNPAYEIADEVNDMEERYQRIKLLEGQLKKLGNACQQLLRMFYYQKVALKEIAQTMNLTEKSAKNNKYRCMQKLRTIYTDEKQEI